MKNKLKTLHFLLRITCVILLLLVFHGRRLCTKQRFMRKSVVTALYEPDSLRFVIAREYDFEIHLVYSKIKFPGMIRVAKQIQCILVGIRSKDM